MIKKNYFNIFLTLFVLIIFIFNFWYFNKIKIEFENAQTKIENKIKNENEILAEKIKNLSTYLIGEQEKNNQKIEELATFIAFESQKNEERIAESLDSISRLKYENEKNKEMAEYISQGLKDIKKLDILKSKKKIIEKYSKIVLKSTCQFPRHRQFGSVSIIEKGLAKNFQQNNELLLTNLHVLADENGFFPNACQFKNDFYQIDVQRIPKNSQYSQELDYIALPVEKSRILKDGEKYDFCLRPREAGDEILILGYPSIGAVSGLTITEGIISGYENGYYITSAKIARGNSGGIAVSVAGDCILGIPTFVKVGATESLGRVLDIRSILNSL